MDAIVPRTQLRKTIATLLRQHEMKDHSGALEDALFRQEAEKYKTNVLSPMKGFWRQEPKTVQRQGHTLNRYLQKEQSFTEIESLQMIKQLSVESVCLVKCLLLLLALNEAEIWRNAFNAILAVLCPKAIARRYA